MITTVVNRLIDVRSVPSRVVLTVALASYGGLIVAAVAGWPLWGKVLAAMIPWGVVLTRETTMMLRHHGMLALFYLLVVTQGGHFTEHLVQFLQVNVFGLTGADAGGVFSALDTEWVHFVWNTWVLIATIPLLRRYGKGNPWLWLAALAAVWHEVEHLYLIVGYVGAGIEGSPGLLADGGAVAGGLPVTRVDLHFYYNLVEVLPIVAAFGVALRQVRNEWLARTFPSAPEDVLIDVTREADVVSLVDGEVLVHQGDLADSFFVVSRGRLAVIVTDDHGTRIVATVGPGDPIGEMGLLAEAPRSATVRADGPAEVVRIGRDAFVRVAEAGDGADDLRDVAAARERALAGTTAD